METDMEADKFVEGLVEGDLGDHIRELLIKDMVGELRGSYYDDDREWAEGVIEWLTDNYL
jgi:hypothetical protein